MRAIGLIVAAVLIASIPAAAAWKEYPQPGLGFVVEFPADLGDVTSISASRVEAGRAAVFGRFMTVACRSAHVSDLLGQTAGSVRAWLKTSETAAQSRPGVGPRDSRLSQDYNYGSSRPGLKDRPHRRA